jgi:hypothetical protein
MVLWLIVDLRIPPGTSSLSKQTISYSICDGKLVPIFRRGGSKYVALLSV